MSIVRDKLYKVQAGHGDDSHLRRESIKTSKDVCFGKQNNQIYKFNNHHVLHLDVAHIEASYWVFKQLWMVVCELHDTEAALEKLVDK